MGVRTRSGLADVRTVLLADGDMDSGLPDVRNAVMGSRAECSPSRPRCNRENSCLPLMARGALNITEMVYPFTARLCGRRGDHRK